MNARSSLIQDVPRRRIGQWTHVSDERGVGWILDGSDVALYYDPLDWSGDLQGCWVAAGGGFDHEYIDHYLSDAMRYVEWLLEDAGRHRV